MSTEGTQDRPLVDPARPPAREGFMDRLMLALGLRTGASMREDLEEALDEAGEAPDFSPFERTFLRNVLRLRDVRTEDVMVPRTEVFALSETATLREVVAMFQAAGHSRLPVYGETLDDPKGMVHLRDVFAALFLPIDGAEPTIGTPPQIASGAWDEPLAARNLIRPVLYAPSGMPVIDLLVRMQSQRIHMALVIDEYGGTDGLVSLEDLVEMIVGDIEDEHDAAPAAGTLRDVDGRLVADARLPVSVVSPAIGVDLTAEALARDVDTIGGLVAALAGRVPQVGETVPGPEGLAFTILEADQRRLKRILIVEPGAESAATDVAEVP